MEFTSLTEFVNTVGPLNITNDLTNIKNVIDSFHNIRKGCSCDRVKRINVANTLYSNLFNTLTELEKVFLRAAFPNQPVIFKDGNNLIGSL